MSESRSGGTPAARPQVIEEGLKWLAGGSDENVLEWRMRHGKEFSDAVVALGFQVLGLGAEVASLREAAQECNQAWQQVIVRNTVPGVPRMARAISLLNEVLRGALAPASREPQ